MRNVDIHVQRKDYGYMLSDRNIKTYRDGKEQGKTLWLHLMRTSDNKLTRERLTNGYFEGFPFIITIMPKDAMKGTVSLGDFGRLPQNAKTFVVD